MKNFAFLALFAMTTVATTAYAQTSPRDGCPILSGNYKCVDGTETHKFNIVEIDRSADQTSYWITSDLMPSLLNSVISDGSEQVFADSNDFKQGSYRASCSNALVLDIAIKGISRQGWTDIGLQLSPQVTPSQKSLAVTYSRMDSFARVQSNYICTSNHQ